FDDTAFREDRFEQFLIRTGTSWPLRPDGRFNLDAETFRQVSNYIPAIQELADLRNSISQLRLNDLAVGKDGRNRTLLSAFASKTSRNQPSNSKYIFGLSRWMRGLIKPPPGHGLAYIDWSQQEFGIAAALSGDPNMIAAYRSGDPYLAFAKQ